MADEEPPEIPIRSPIRLDQIPATGLARRIEADEMQCAEIARLLDLVSLDLLTLDARIVPAERGRFTVSGRFAARGQQSCVVTLEGVPFTFDEALKSEFWPLNQIERLEAEQDPQSGAPLFDWPEPIVDAAIDLGALLYETLAISLEPFPRKPEASIDESIAAPRAHNPFAALAKLKRN